MTSKYKFELTLEKVAERFYFNGATQYGKVRGGNSSDNEAYFRNVATDLRRELDCQQIHLKKGACPDSGVFGNFFYKNEEEVDWENVKEGKIVVLEVEGVERQLRYIEIKSEEIEFPEEPIRKEPGISIDLNSFNGYGEFFGVEYKAAKNKSENSVSVASFNSTCPSSHKTSTLKKVKLIHNLRSRSNIEVHGYNLKQCLITVNISFSIYYLIINDYPKDSVSEIKQIFICDGGFFAPGVSQAKAKELSTQFYPDELGVEYNLYRVSLRYRPFFDSRTIRTNGFGLYTSWEPKIPLEEKVEKQRQALLREVEKIQQDFNELAEAEDENEEIDNVEPKELPSQAPEDNPDNVIYLSLREDRIKKRAA